MPPAFNLSQYQTLQLKNERHPEGQPKSSYEDKNWRPGNGIIHEWNQRRPGRSFHRHEADVSWTAKSQLISFRTSLPRQPGRLASCLKLTFASQGCSRMISCEPDHPRVSPSRHTCVNTYAARSHPRGLSSNCSLFKELDQLGPALDKLPSAMPNNATRPTIRRAIWQVRDCTVVEWVVNLPRDLIWSFSRLSFNLPQTSIRRYRQNCRMDRNRPQMPQKPPASLMDRPVVRTSSTSRTDRPLNSEYGQSPPLCRPRRIPNSRLLAFSRSVRERPACGTPAAF